MSHARTIATLLLIVTALSPGCAARQGPVAAGTPQQAAMDLAHLDELVFGISMDELANAVHACHLSDEDEEPYGPLLHHFTSWSGTVETVCVSGSIHGRVHYFVLVDGALAEIVPDERIWHIRRAWQTDPLELGDELRAARTMPRDELRAIWINDLETERRIVAASEPGILPLLAFATARWGEVRVKLEHMARFRELATTRTGLAVQRGVGQADIEPLLGRRRFSVPTDGGCRLDVYGRDESLSGWGVPRVLVKSCEGEATAAYTLWLQVPRERGDDRR